jgi:hypothetical protein
MITRPSSLQPGALMTHLAVRSLDAFAAIVAATEQPWTRRVAAVKAVGVWPQPTFFAFGSRGQKMLNDYTDAIAEQMKRIRCARLAIDGALNLIDPFTGRRLEMLNCRL